MDNLRKDHPYHISLNEMYEVHNASKPRVLTLLDQRAPQERSNEVWQTLGEKYGFDWTTVVPHPNGDQQWIIAKPKALLP